jgi:hypothetical protein
VNARAAARRTARLAPNAARLVSTPQSIAARPAGPGR